MGTNSAKYQREYMRKYYRTAGGKKKMLAQHKRFMKKYQKTEKYKIARRVYMKIYRQSPQYRSYRKEYEKRVKRK